MEVFELSTQQRHPVQIVPLHNRDFSKISVKRYFFDWKKEKDYELVKLVRLADSSILGLMSFEIVDVKMRIHIRLLTSSRENVGKSKLYDGIVGNLLAYAAQRALFLYGNMAFVSLTPKTQLVSNYMDKYNMYITGKTLSMGLPELLGLLKKYI